MSSQCWSCMEFNSPQLEQALQVLGTKLLDDGENYEIVIIGGASLLLLGYSDRTTKDIDIVGVIEKGNLLSADPLPQKLNKAIQEVGTALGMTTNWINSGPTTLLDFGLPKGFHERLIRKEFGALTVHLASRFDQISFKLYASVDQGPRSKHFADLKLLDPKNNELLSAKKWCLTHDQSQPFQDELNKALNYLGVANEDS